MAKNKQNKSNSETVNAFVSTPTTALDVLVKEPAETEVEQEHVVPVAEVGTVPPLPHDGHKYPITNHRRRLTPEEKANLTPDQKAARCASVKAMLGFDLPAKGRFTKKVSSVLEHITTIAAAFAGEVDLRETFQSIAKELRDSMVDISELPDDWKPAGSRRTVNTPETIKVGCVVQLTKNKAKDYEGLVEGELVVTKVAGKNVVVRMSSGVCIVLPMTHFVFVRAS